eukprot:g4819.t1
MKVDNETRKKKKRPRSAPPGQRRNKTTQCNVSHLLLRGTTATKARDRCTRQENKEREKKREEKEKFNKHFKLSGRMKFGKPEEHLDKSVTRKKPKWNSPLKYMLEGRGKGRNVLESVQIKFRALAFDGVVNEGRLFREFHRFDVDNNGTISYEELRKVLSRFFNFSEYEMQCIFRAFDPDQSGDISYQEFLETMELGHEERKKEHSYDYRPSHSERATNRVLESDTTSERRGTYFGTFSPDGSPYRRRSSVGNRSPSSTEGKVMREEERTPLSYDFDSRYQKGNNLGYAERFLKRKEEEGDFALDVESKLFKPFSEYNRYSSPRKAKVPLHSNSNSKPFIYTSMNAGEEDIKVAKLRSRVAMLESKLAKAEALAKAAVLDLDVKGNLANQTTKSETEEMSGRSIQDPSLKSSEQRRKRSVSFSDSDQVFRFRQPEFEEQEEKNVHKARPFPGPKVIRSTAAWLVDSTKEGKQKSGDYEELEFAYSPPARYGNATKRYLQVMQRGMASNSGERGIV